MSTKTGSSDIFRLGDLPRNVTRRVAKLPRALADGVTTAGRDAWLAGLGALATVESESTALYDRLVKQGETLVERGEALEQRGKRRFETLKDEVETRREEVAEKVETAVYDPMAEALRKLGIPTRAEVRRLSRQVEGLTERVNLLIARLEQAPVERAAFAVVLRGDEGWAVERAGAERAVSLHATKEEALERARSLAGEHRPSTLVVHRRDGTVQDTIAYDA
ncbi:MAG TPA: phasin family protein [Longimicrobiaceae bacterium]|nr:phasin family protein [Longimicrobiaceae bacterium]